MSSANEKGLKFIIDLHLIAEECARHSANPAQYRVCVAPRTYDVPFETAKEGLSNFWEVRNDRGLDFPLDALYVCLAEGKILWLSAEGVIRWADSTPEQVEAFREQLEGESQTTITTGVWSLFD